MTLVLYLTNGKRIQRTRPKGIVARNTKKKNGKIYTQFFDEDEYNSNKFDIVPFAECPYSIIKRMKGVFPVISTYAK